MTLKTYTGNIIDFTNINPDSIKLEDIIRSLPRLNRFVGHSSRTYSVAEHSIFCYYVAEKMGYSTREKLLVFIHDFTEAYCNDCPAPLKHLIPDFSMYEKNIELAICKSLGIEPPTEEEHLKVKRVDLTMLLVEMKYLTSHDWRDYVSEYTYLDIINDKQFRLNSIITPSEKELRTYMNHIYLNLLRDLNKR